MTLLARPERRRRSSGGTARGFVFALLCLAAPPVAAAPSESSPWTWRDLDTVTDAATAAALLPPED
jgi:hypothetical protein